jgi:hypothetical protein
MRRHLHWSRGRTEYRRTLFLAALLPFIALLSLSGTAYADDAAMCPQGATVTSKFVKNTSGLPVKIEVTTPGSPAIVITQTAQLPPGVVCRATGRIGFLADASTDKGKSFHRVMTRTASGPNGGLLVEAAPDSFNGNFAYSAQFSISVKPR